jgi:ABC-2 type transport system ATP-binding protein
MIELTDIWQHYGVRPILKHLSLKINSGELVVIIGPNGMGKSTLLGVMAGVLSPQKGEVRIDGKRRRGSVEEENAIRQITVFVPDNPWLPQQRTPREFLLAVSRLYDVPYERLFDHVDKLLALFDLTTKAEAAISSLSSGQQKKTALCGALITEARILLLDEPFSGGLDPAGILALKKVLRHRVEQGGTVVITSPVPEIVEEVADHILILKEGEILAFDHLEGLRRLSGVSGSLSQILEKLLYPETTQKLAEYFAEGGR